jgi:hypothetical protein
MVAGDPVTRRNLKMSHGFKLFQRLTLFALGVLLVTVMSVPNVHAQAAFGTILGTVTDTTGAVVPGAAVTVTNTGTNLASHVISDDHGRYVAASLIPGTYAVQVEKAGFQKVIQQGIILSVGASVVADETLPVGKVDQVVEVQSQVAQVDTTTSTLSNLVDNTQMVGLPLNGRDYTQLLTLAPGIQQSQDSTTITIGGKGPEYSVAGQRSEGGAYLLDGTDVQNYANHGPGSDVLGTTLGIDAIAEFSILTNSYSAQYGGNGVAINAATRSGTNQMHGSAFDFLRNSKLDTRNYFDRTGVAPDFTPTSLPEFRRNQYGGTLGGPIRKDKMFYFVNYEGLAAAQGYTESVFVPDAEAQKGYLYCGPVGSAYALQPCPGEDETGTLEHVGIDPATAPLLPLYPATTSIAADGSGIVQQTLVASDKSHENYVLGRIDGVLASKDTIFGRFVLDRSTYINPFDLSPIPTWPDNEYNQNVYFTLGERHVFSDNVVNSIREGYTRNLIVVNVDNASAALAIFTGAQSDLDTNVLVGGLSALGPNPGEANSSQFQGKWSVGDDLIWTKGAHTLTAGVDVQRVDSFTNAGYLAGGEFPFAGLLQLLQNSPEFFLGALPGHTNPYASESETRFSPYINDVWKVSRKLTLNAGLRYDYVSDPVCTSGDCSTVTNLLTSTGWSPVHQLFAGNPSTHNWDPRIGLAWDPFGDHKTSIRAGFALFHDPVRPNIYMPGYGGNGSQFYVDFIPGEPYPTSAVTFTNFLASLSAAAPPSSSFSSDYNMSRTPYSEQWNLTVQRSLGWGTVLEVAYVGSRGVHLLTATDANPELNYNEHCTNCWQWPLGVPGGPGGAAPNPRVNPNLAALNYGEPFGWSSYNSLQVNLTRQFSHGLTLQANNTWAKCLDLTDGVNASYNGAGPVSNPWDPAADYGLCGYNQTETFHANAVYELPFNGNQFKAGWQTSLITTATTGQPFSPILGFDNANTNQQGDPPPYFNERPNLNSGYSCNSSLITGNPNGWFKTDAFSTPEAGTLGNLRRNCINGPGFFDLDYSLGKETKIGERLSALLRVEAFNIINHTNFVQQPGTVGSLDASWQVLNGEPGVITTTQNSSRQIQVSLRLQF